jgi:hypothetical protein
MLTAKTFPELTDSQKESLVMEQLKSIVEDKHLGDETE